MNYYWEKDSQWTQWTHRRDVKSINTRSGHDSGCALDQRIANLRRLPSSGSVYIYRAKVALADFDGRDFGEALRSSAAMNNGSYGYPTYININVVGSSPEQMRREVFKGTYWAAIVVEPGASARFQDAVNGSAPTYDPSRVYTYYVLDARYYTLYASSILSKTATTASTASGVFSAEVIAPIIASGGYANTSAAHSALVNPAGAVATTRLSSILSGLYFLF